MQPIADLLRDALREGDEQGRTQIRSRHLPGDIVAELAKQTYQHVLNHAAGESSDGWLIFRGGIEAWWRDEAGLTKGEFSRLFHLRTDIVKRLTEEGLACRSRPRSNLLYVRRDAT